MTRTLKAFGLILAVVLALGGSAVTSASPQEEGSLTADGPITLKLSQKAAGNLFFTNGAKYECPGSIYTGHKFDVTPHEPADPGAGVVTITPHFKDCTSGGKKVTITMNGCDFALRILDAGGGKLKLDSFIDCPDGKKIVEDVYASADNENLKVCEIATGPQEDLTGATIKEAESGKLAIEGTFKGIHTESSGLCGSSTSTSGEWEVNLEVEGLNKEGKSTALSLSV